MIVDGGSEDNTLQIINSNLKNSGVKYDILYDEGKGLGFARQMVLENSTSPFILWVDSDVILSEKFVNKIYQYIKSRPRVGLCRGGSEYIDTGSVLSDVHNLLFSSLDIIYFGATMSRLEGMKSVGGFDRSIKGAAEDVDLKKRMLEKGWTFDVVEEAVFYHVPKDTFNSLYRQYRWYGFGDYFINQKYVGIVKPVYRLPPPYFFWAMKIAMKSYRKFQKMKSFLIPLFSLFISLSWWIGFSDARTQKYGHSPK